MLNLSLFSWSVHLLYLSDGKWFLYHQGVLCYNLFVMAILPWFFLEHPRESVGFSKVTGRGRKPGLAPRIFGLEFFCSVDRKRYLLLPQTEFSCWNQQASLFACISPCYLGWDIPQMWRTLVWHWIKTAGIVPMSMEYRFLDLCGIMVFCWGSGWLWLLCAWSQNYHGRSMSLRLRLARILFSWLCVLLFPLINAFLS